MRLDAVIANIAELDPGMTIYVAASTRSPDAEAMVLCGKDPPSGFVYFLEVDLALEAIEVWSR